MKKIFIATAIAAASITAWFVYHYSNTAVAENAGNKTISMAVYTSNNYTAKIYDAATAGLTVIVKKLNAKNNEVVLQQSFPALALKLFPSSENAFKPAITIPAVSGKDVLEVSYTLTYNSKGSILQMEGNQVIDGKTDNAIDINI
ncbi:MAG TPA: hypothetical protein VHB48_01115 [Chitinophagaceae bacterium]|nr:hypothetical protein [Chitinophagaceae bacterium]